MIKSEFISKFDTVASMMAEGYDLTARDKSTWTVPAIYPEPSPCKQHGVTPCGNVYCQPGVIRPSDTIETAGEHRVVAIVPTFDDGGYMSIINARLLRSRRNWFQPSGLLSDESDVVVYRLLQFEAYSGGVGSCMKWLRRQDTGRAKWPGLHILLDDSSLGSLEAAPFKTLTSDAEGRFRPLSVALRQEYKILEPGSKELLALGAGKMLADLRSIFTQRRLVIPPDLEKQPLVGSVLMHQLKTSLNRSADGSFRLLGRKPGEYEPEKYGALYSLGLAVSYAEITTYRVYAW